MDQEAKLIPLRSAIDRLGINIDTWRASASTFPPVAEWTGNGRARKMVLNLDIETFVRSRGKYRTHGEFERARIAAAKDGIELIIGEPEPA